MVSRTSWYNKGSVAVFAFAKDTGRPQPPGQQRATEFIVAELRDA
jgi:hypothetical protein